MRSTFGECSGNVRSTPTPNDCLRTVNVSRAPDPWRLMTMPSKTWIRRRWPSMTRKWTRTVSPALNAGRPSRSWARSSCSMTSDIGKGASRAAGMLAHADPRGRPVNPDHPGDQRPPARRPPDARVAGLATGVSEQEVAALRHAPPRKTLAVPSLDIGLPETPAIDQDRAVPLGDGLSGQADHALEVRPGSAAGPRSRFRHPHGDHVAP